MKADCKKKYLNHPLFIPLIVLFIYLSPFYILGENAYLSITDNLNYYANQLLAKSNILFGGMHSFFPYMLEGIPRNALPSELNITMLLHRFFPFYAAHAIDQTLIRIIGLLGMYLLLKRHVFKNRDNNSIIILGVSLAFALLSVCPWDGLSILGQPLVLYAFLNIREKKSNTYDWLILLCVPFYSKFILSYIFTIPILGLLWLYDTVKTRKINYKFLLALILMSLVFLIVEYRLIHLFLFENFIPHRYGFNMTRYNFQSCLDVALGLFFIGEFFSKSHPVPFIIPSILIYTYTLIRHRVKETSVLKVFSLILLICLISGFNFWEGFQGIKSGLKILNGFNIRLTWILPLLWYITFALSLNTIMKKLNYGKYIAIFLLISQIIFLFYRCDFVREKLTSNLTYKEFYSEKLFGDIRNYIGKDTSTYRIVSIGLHPAISQNSGFYTLDGYINNYPLEYKHKFREIMEKEINKNPAGAAKLRFDTWGNACYVYVSELNCNYEVRKDSHIKIKHLDLNTSALKELGGNYIFSAAEIVNYKQENLVFLKVFEDKNSPWRIYLYKVS